MSRMPGGSPGNKLGRTCENAIRWLKNCRRITLDTYSHVLPGMQDDAVAKVDAAIQAALNKPKTK
jgi:hypothetical protein